MGIESLRGIDPLLSDLNDSALLVRASIDVVTEALCRAKQAVDWRTDVYEHEVSISGSSLLAFQFRGQSWTFIHELNFLYLEFLEDAQLLSRLLSTDAVSYAISDFEQAYQLYESRGDLEAAALIQASIDSLKNIP